MNYEGEKFLLKLYQDLDKQEGVLIAEKRSGKNSGNKYELLQKYLKRLERQEKIFDGEHQELEKFLKNRYYEKYVIKEDDIPDSYWELQEKIALERGHGHVKYTDELKHKETITIIENQKKSLDKWINYLMKENASYPMWTRYWAFQGMLKLGKYDKEKHSFSKRSKGTVSPFVELNAESLAHTIRIVQSYYEGNSIDDAELKQLVESGNFGKIYSYNIWKLIEEEKENNKDKLDANDGIWKIFTEGQEKELVKLLEGKGTGWCIAEEETAKDYLGKGNMHIFFTKDKKGKYTMPRVCIRQKYGEIEEVRGIAQDQNMESEMLDITDKKLDEFEDKELYKKKVHDMKKLTQIYNKAKLNQKLTNDELRFLYEIDENIKGFGWEEDPRIDELHKECIIADKEFILEAIKNHRNIVDWNRVSEDLKNDKEVVLEALKQHSFAIKYDSEKLRNDKEFILEAMKIDLAALRGYASEELRDDKEFILEAIKINSSVALECASENLKNDKELVLEAVKRYGRALKYASENLKNDKEIVLEAIKKDATSLVFASENLKNDKELVLEAVKRYGGALQYASENLKNDKEFILEAIKENVSALRYISEDLKNDKEVATEAIEKDVSALRYISENLKNDKEILIEVIKKDVSAVDWNNVSEELKNDKEVILEAIKQDSNALQYASENLRNDKEVVLEAITRNYFAYFSVGKELKNDEEFMSEVRNLCDELYSNIDRKVSRK